MEEAINRIQTFHDLGELALKFYGDKIAIQDSENPNDKHTYSHLLKASYQVGNFLQNHFGLQHQEVVATLLPNCWQCFPIHIGTSMVGGILTGLSPQFTPFEIKHQLRDSDTVIAFVHIDFLASVLKIVPECPELRALVILGTRSTVVKTSLPVYYWDDIAACSSLRPVPKHPINPSEDLCWLPYSSGTTGLPKGVMHTHLGFILHFKAQLKHGLEVIAPAYQLPPSDYSIWFLPFYHAMGHYAIMQALLNGKTAILLKKYSLKRMLELVQRYKIAQLSGVPSIAHQLVKDPIVKNYDLTSVRIITSGGSKLDEQTMLELKRRFPHIDRIAQGYGMTEAVTGIIMSTGREEQPVNSVGIALSGVQIKIVDPETEKECPVGQPGELRCKIAHIMKGYWKNEKATRESFDANGYFKTGDTATIDAKGYVTIVDRLKELIKVKSFQVPPAEIEEVLMMNPKIKDAAVVGIPHFDYGEIPKAFVVPQDGCTLTEREVQAYVAELLSHYKHLKGGVEFVNVIPRTMSGKIQRRLLKERSKTASKL